MPGILVVEDDENLNRGITFSLKKSGYEVFSAESVKKAKRIASDNNVDVTICDVNLPDGNGLELVRWMRNCQNVYIICLATVYKGNIIKNLIMDCQSYTKYRPNETTGGIFVSWRRKEELPTGA